MARTAFSLLVLSISTWLFFVVMFHPCERGGDRVRKERGYMFEVSHGTLTVMGKGQLNRPVRCDIAFMFTNVAFVRVNGEQAFIEATRRFAGKYWNCSKGQTLNEKGSKMMLPIIPQEPFARPASGAMFARTITFIPIAISTFFFGIACVNDVMTESVHGAQEKSVHSLVHEPQCRIARRDCVQVTNGIQWVVVVKFLSTVGDGWKLVKIAN
ncbi:hypothetical protein EI94DRAFT_1708201 [Lactarius quietus]|nr:hypothetical protein EI94DRAFT_1708201 [Lactarius quietus]